MDKEPKPSAICAGQKVTEAKVHAAREMRKHMTPTETLLWQRLRKGQLEGFHFRRQQVVDGFIADFYCHSAGVAVEVDGPTHDAEYDKERDIIFAAKGIVTLRFTNDEVVKQTEGVLNRIVQEIKARRT